MVSVLETLPTPGETQSSRLVPHHGGAQDKMRSKGGEEWRSSEEGEVRASQAAG